MMAGCFREKNMAHNKYKQAHGEMDRADTGGAEEWLSIVLPQLLREYKLTIFTMRTRRGCTTERLQMDLYVTLTNNSVSLRRLSTA